MEIQIKINIKPLHPLRLQVVVRTTLLKVPPFLPSKAGASLIVVNPKVSPNFLACKDADVDAFFLSFFGLDADQSSDITCHSTSLSLSSLNEQKNWPSHKLFRISSIKELDLLLRTESTLESQTETEMESQTTTS